MTLVFSSKKRKTSNKFQARESTISKTEVSQRSIANLLILVSFCSLQMSPIENVVPTLVEVHNPPQNLEISNKQDRTRDLFGIQLEVIYNFNDFERAMF